MRAPLVTASLLVSVGAQLGASGCVAVPAGRAAVDSVAIFGAQSVDPGEINDRLATTASPRFLGLIAGLANDYALYDASVLQRDLARVERYYRARGFLDAHARAARVISGGAGHVRVQIAVDEGRSVQNGALRVEGVAGLAPNVRSAVRAAILGELSAGKRFDEDAYQRAQRDAVRALTERGYPYATVKADARVDLATHTIDYDISLSPGTAAVVGPITFAGLVSHRLSLTSQADQEKLLRHVMKIRPGGRYSSAQIESATQALLDLQVFSSVHVVAGLAEPPVSVVPLLVQVEPAKLRALRLGVGAEFDQIKTDVHALIGWNDHDFLGGLRNLSVDLKPGVVLYPTSLTDFAKPTSLLPEEWLRLQFRQPAFLEARTEGFIQPSFNVYPLLVEVAPQENENVVGYLEPKLSMGVDRRFGKHLFTKLAYNLQGEVPLAYRGSLDSKLPTGSKLPTDSKLPTVVLSFPQLIGQLDFKDNPVHPHAGFAVNADLQVAGGPFGGSATDVRFQPDIEGYIPISRSVTLALSATLGLLFPLNYGESVEKLRDNATATNADIETVYFRGYFSGGTSSNRGYPLRGVAPHGFVPFLNPATAAMQVAAKCSPSNKQATALTCSSPVGGFTQWEASAEIRLAISGPFGAAIFCDAGDVSEFVLFRNAHALRLNYLHLSCGVGGRYDTPVGPIRLDIGYRLPGLQIIGQSDPAAYNSTFGSPPNLLVFPVAIAFGIGEAF